jgi:type VI secretion system secreted protein VgrG
MPVEANQKHFSFETSAVSADTLQVVDFSGVEEMSRTYRFVVRLASDDPELDLDAVIGKPATLKVQRREGDALPIHGVVSEFHQGARISDWYSYEATLVPRLWLLSLSFQSRVFQQMRVDEIVSDVLKQSGFGSRDFRFALKAKLPQREYCVQYRETDLDFIQRLLEHEGIYYFFEHPADGNEVVVFTDDRGESADIDGGRKVEFHSGAGLVSDDDIETVREFRARRQVVTGHVVLKDYNYRTPETQLVSRAQLSTEMPGVFYDYGAHFKNAGEGDRLAKVRSEELEAGRCVFHGESDVPSLRSGHVFALAEHFRSTFNSDYLITRVEHTGSQGRGFGLGFEAPVASYKNTFSAQPATTQFRPARATQIPRISGIITARLETGGGDYAYIDDQGRYKVKLPFDLSGKGSGSASRAVRMAQPYSGAGYGMHFPNRAGGEMVLACIDGDVDRPIGLSTVPNPSNSSPVTAGNNAQCVIRSAGNNEFTLDDSIGAENILLHGTKDWTVDIVNDKTQGVGKNESTTIGANQTLVVKADREKTVKGHEKETITGTKTIAVTGSHTETVDGGMTQTVTGQKSETVKGTKSESVTLTKDLMVGAAYGVKVIAAMNEFVGGLKAEQIIGAKTVDVGAISSETIKFAKSVNAGTDITHEAKAGNLSEKAGANITSDAGENISCSAGQNVSVTAKKGGVVISAKEKLIASADGDFGISAQKKGSIEVQDELTLKCGKASITLSSNGDIVIKGNNVGVKHSADFTTKGSNAGIN